MTPKHRHTSVRRLTKIYLQQLYSDTKSHLGEQLRWSIGTDGERLSKENVQSARLDVDYDFFPTSDIEQLQK